MKGWHNRRIWSKGRDNGRKEKEKGYGLGGEE